MTRSEPATFSSDSMGSISPMRASASAAPRRPRATRPSYSPRIAASARSRASESESIRRTGMPALAKQVAMPLPMVPAPTMAALSMGRTGVSLSIPGTLRAARSAKNTWRSAADSAEAMHAAKISRSLRIPSSKGSSSASSTHSRHATGARWPRARRSRRALVVAKMSGSLSSGVRSRASGCGGPAAMRSCAKAMAPCRRSPSITRSRMPCSAASAAPMGVPSTIMASAFSTPARRGRRWVPPAPGGKPSATSGWPTWVFRLATR